MVYTRISELPARTGSRGFVPTMGALHEGHLSLIRAARRETEEVAVSIFVNPTQFGPREDFSKYPRQLERDVELCRDAGADWIFAPSAEEMYPRKTTVVSVGEVSEAFEGAKRPGHFDGVATVVLKLFNITQPSTAYFGRKDLQQCQVIKRMVEDLNVPLRLVFGETVREPDGLAMSSRNRYLSEENRAVAPMLYRELTLLRDQVRAAKPEAIQHLLDLSAGRLVQSGFQLDYLDLIDLPTMRPTRDCSDECALVVAAKLGETRLIDNVLVNS
ncbi:MAG TPA: pantoate--beta-alanine ligase [Fimbriimonas sp.]